MKLRLLVPLAATACLQPLAAHADLLLAAFGGDAIYRYDGITAVPFATDPDPGGPNAMDGPTALVYDASGNLLVLDEFSKNVLKFNGTTGAFITNFIPTSSILTTAGITDPADMELGADGNLYIMGHGAVGGNNIHRFNGITGAYMGVWSAIGVDRHQHGLAFGPGGDLYQGVVDAKNIERWSGATGAPLGVFASNASMGPVADLAFSSTTLYVTVDGGGGVKRFNAVSGVSMSDLIAPGASESYWGILVDGADLYVSNKATGHLLKYNASTGGFVSDTTLAGGAFDIIPMPVPEPSAVGVLALATLIFGRRRRRI